jgi:hypothetical protein
MEDDDRPESPVCVVDRRAAPADSGETEDGDLNFPQSIEQIPGRQGFPFSIPTLWSRLLLDETGQDLIEYALLAALTSPGG